MQTVEQQAMEMKAELATQADEYSKEIKAYVENATKGYQSDLLKCSEQQQDKIHQMIRKWDEQQGRQSKDQGVLTTTPAYNKVPEQVEITTTASQMGMSRKSMDPPDEMTIHTHRQQTRLVLDVRVQDVDRLTGEKLSQQHDRLDDRPMQHRWTNVDDPRGWMAQQDA
jgi:hypothetical protein